MPRFSVVIPAYNAAATIEQTVSSVLVQTEADLELIVVDDGSSDDTPARVKALDDPRISLISQANQGTAAARNTGVSRASAGYVSFLDNDDLWMPNYLAAMGIALDRNPQAGFAYCDAWGLDDQTSRIHRFTEMRYRPAPPASASRDQVLTTLASQNFVMSSSTVRREVLQQLGGFDPTVRGTDDYDLWLRIVLSGWTAARAGDEPLLLQRGRHDSQSKDERMMDHNLRLVLRRVADDERAPPHARAVASRRAAGLDLDLEAVGPWDRARRLPAGLRVRAIAIRNRLRFSHYYPAEPPAAVAAAFPELGTPSRDS
jgi:glycosyltransferase involved in cell wall biosynthesis